MNGEKYSGLFTLRKYNIYWYWAETAGIQDHWEFYIFNNGDATLLPLSLWHVHHTIRTTLWRTFFCIKGFLFFIFFLMYMMSCLCYVNKPGRGPGLTWESKSEMVLPSRALIRYPLTFLILIFFFLSVGDSLFTLKCTKYLSNSKQEKSKHTLHNILVSTW